MPLTRCSEDGKPGWKWGESGKCYTFTRGDAASERAARKKARDQAVAIAGNRARKRGEKTPKDRDFK
jgi:hypothetical protein